MAAVALLSSQALAEDVHVYSSATLDALWKNSVSSQVLSSLTPDQFKASLAAGTSPAPSSTPQPGGSRGGFTPPSQSGGSQQTVYFAVVDIDPRLEAELVGRQIALATYLTKSELYQADSVAAANPNAGSLADFQAAKAKSDEQTRVIALRRYAAQVELFLIAIMRYYSVDTIPEKCAKLREAQDLLGQLVAAKIEVSAIRARPGSALQLEPRFAALETIEADVAQRYTGDLSATTACQVSPASSRKADLATAAAQLEASLNDDLTNNGAMKTTLAAINEVQQGFADLQNTVSAIDPHTNRLLDLELKVSNAASNLNMVRTDALGVQAKVAQMEQTVDINAIANLGNMTPDQLRKIGELGALDSAMTHLSGASASYLSLLLHLNGMADVQDPAKSLAPCAAINPDFIAAPNADPKPVTDCLTALKALLDAASRQTPFQLEMTEFSSQVQTMSPEIIKDRSGH